MAMAAAKKSAAKRPFCTVAGSARSVSADRRETTRSAIRNRQAAAKVECTM
jgi:hypothetical protein